MSTDYEPTPEAIEAEAKLACEAHYDGTNSPRTWSTLIEYTRDGYRANARRVLKRQHSRESILTDALNWIARYGHPGSRATAETALAALAALDAPHVPTLLEAAKKVIDNVTVDVLKFDLGAYVTLNGWPTAVEDMQALKAAVERAERAK